jgi:hypothetical protein
MLAPGTYSLRATAYSGISCNGGRSSCEWPQMLDWCLDPGATHQPVSCGAPLTAEDTLDLGSGLGLHAAWVFGKVAGSRFLPNLPSRLPRRLANSPASTSPNLVLPITDAGSLWAASKAETHGCGARRMLFLFA